MAPDYVLTVDRGSRRESVLLEEHIAEDGWPPKAWSAEFSYSMLDDDAVETVAEEVTEVLRLWGLLWPQCGEHGTRLVSCSCVWVCDGPPGHDVPVGQLSGRLA